MSSLNISPNRIDRKSGKSASIYTLDCTGFGVGQHLRPKPNRPFKPKGTTVPLGVRSWKARLWTRKSNSATDSNGRIRSAFSRGVDRMSIASRSTWFRALELNSLEFCRVLLRDWYAVCRHSRVVCLCLAFRLWRPPVRRPAIAK